MSPMRPMLPLEWGISMWEILALVAVIALIVLVMRRLASPEVRAARDNPWFLLAPEAERRNEGPGASNAGAEASDEQDNPGTPTRGQ